MIDNSHYFSKIPQSVLVSGAALQSISHFVKTWAGHLLKVEADSVEKHPDFYAVHPHNKMRQINVETLREFNRNVYTSAQQGGRKVFVLYEADRLNISAANALLKTLEEPTPSSCIFLVTLRPYEILPTLRSRCWWIQLNEDRPSLPQVELQAWFLDVKKMVENSIKTPVSPLEIYGLLYRLQSFIAQQTLEEQPNDELLSNEEKIAQTAGAEKQIVQQIFQAIENILNEIVRTSPEAKHLYPRWIQSIEKCFKRTEVNFGTLPALEAFLLQFCQ